MIKMTFKSGSLKGKSLGLVPRSEYVIGRSHACDIRCIEDDVSGRHLKISVTLDGLVTMTVDSRYGIMHNGTKCTQGSSVELKPGDEVKLGKSIVFVVEGESDLDDACTMVQPDEETGQLSSTGSGFIFDHTNVFDRTGVRQQRNTMPTPDQPHVDNLGTSPGGETVAIKTLAGSEEDIEKIKLAYKVKRRNRTLAWILPMMLAFVSLVAAYMVLRPLPEEFTSWPKDENGRFLNKFVLVEPFLAVCVPDIPAFLAQDTQTGKRIESALGRYRDIPLAITVERIQDKALLEMDHSEAVDSYVLHRRETDTMFSPGVNRIKKFLCVTSGAGVPVSYVDYTRRSGADEYFGYLLYLRRADVAYAFSIEVPLSARWRADNFLVSSLDAFVLYAPKRVPEHWEGGRWFRRSTPIARDLDEAKSYLVRSKSPMNWEKGLYCLKSVLIKGTAEGNAEAVKEAEDLLVKLRVRQSEWYNTCKLGYLQAQIADDKERMQSLQAMCESVFTAAFQECDYRYERIKRKDWR